MEVVFHASGNAHFFKNFSRCSRVYWSTTDARKRCVYTCKIVECRPPVVEPDINSTVEHDENRTIAHSPAPLTGKSLKMPFNGRPSIQCIVFAPKWLVTLRLHSL